MKWTGIYFVGYVIFMAGLFAALWKLDVLAKIGTTVKEPRLRIAGQNGEWLIWSKLDELKETWQKPLRW